MTPDGHLVGILLGGNKEQGIIAGANLSNIFKTVKECSYVLAEAILSGRMRDITYSYPIQGKIKRNEVKPTGQYIFVSPLIMIGEYLPGQNPNKGK